MECFNCSMVLFQLYPMWPVGGTLHTCRTILILVFQVYECVCVFVIYVHNYADSWTFQITSLKSWHAMSTSKNASILNCSFKLNSNVMTFFSIYPQIWWAMVVQPVEVSCLWCHRVHGFPNQEPQECSMGLMSGDLTTVHDSQHTLVFFGLQEVLAKLGCVFGVIILLQYELLVHKDATQRVKHGVVWPYFPSLGVI